MSNFDRDLYRELKKMRDKVEWILHNYPKTRDNDFYLIIIYLKQFGGCSNYIGRIPWELIEANSNIAGVWRMRQKIQNEYGLYPPSDPVRKQRQARAKKYRATITRM